MRAGTAGNGSSRLRARSGGWLASIPPEAILVGLGLFVLLAAFAAADPVNGVTDSVAPFTDEIGNVINARNFAQLGVWSTDEWNLYLVNLPFSLAEAAVFKVFGVGVLQARLPMILCVSLAATALVWGLRGVVGRRVATFAGLAFGFSGLILFYGRMAFLEDLVVLGLTLGTLTLVRRGFLNLGGGVLAGLFYAVAIGTKPNAAFAVAGIALALALVWGWRDQGIRQWLTGAIGTIVAAGLLWAVAIWLPNREQVKLDLQIWPPYQVYLNPWQLIQSIGGYMTGRNDHILGFVLLPLIVLAAAGLAVIVIRRQRLTEEQARLAAVAFGWALVGFGILCLVSYRPNRYVVPLVPSLAILAAIGLRLALDWLRDKAVAAAVTETESPAPDTAPLAHPAETWGPVVALALAIAIAVLPGLLWYGNWARGATYGLVDAQPKVVDVIPANEGVAGTADMALFLMPSHARTVIYGLANKGDLYAAGMRWYMLASDATAPKGVPDDVWASRLTVACFPWRGNSLCLYRLT